MHVVLGGAGFVGGALWAGAAESAKMARDTASFGAAETIGSAFGAGDLAGNAVPDPYRC